MPNKRSFSTSQKGFTLILIIVGVLILAWVGYIIYKHPWGPVYNGPLPASSLVACTQEAKICPDGTSVGRTGPNCEFAACPTTNASPTASSSSKASCLPRPACLDTTPRCMLPEPANGWCK